MKFCGMFRIGVCGKAVLREDGAKKRGKIRKIHENAPRIAQNAVLGLLSFQKMNKYDKN